MTLRTRIADALRAPYPAMTSSQLSPPQRRALPTVALYRYGRPVWPEANVHTALTAYEQVVVVFACINWLADAAATARVAVVDERQDGIELPDHPLRQLMRQPNPSMSEAEWINANVKIAAVAGFCVNEITRDGTRRPTGLYPLRSDWLQPIARRDGRVDWEYRVPGDSVTYHLLAEDVLAWTFQSGPLLGAAGISPIAAARREIAIENDATGFVKSFFDSGAIPQIGLVPAEGAELDQAEADVLREKFMQFSGQQWVPIVMQAIIDVKRLGFDLNEMAYKDLRALSSTQIATAFRVPPVMLGTLVGLENSPWSKYEEARRSFYEDTITPLWARLDGALTRSLLPEFETNPAISLEFDTSRVPALADDDSVDWAHATMPGVAEFATINERRALVGLPPLTGGDVRILSIAQIEVPAGDELLPTRSRLVAGEWREVTPALTTGMAAAQEIRATHAATNRTTMLRLAERFAPVLGRFWRSQGQRLMEQTGFRQDGTTFETRALEEIDWAEEDRLLAEELKKLAIQAAEGAFAAASAQLDIAISFDLANPQLGRTMEQLLTRASGINETTRQAMATLITDSLSEGVTLAELSNRISSQFDDFGEARAMVVARSESQVSFNTASTLAYRESGVVDRAQLHDNAEHGGYGGDGDGLTCAQRNGMIVPLSQVDTHVMGTHPSCILAVSPVLTSDFGAE
ncbi:MAG TPA: phage portal protein [Tepidisphaeraceae bacterium]|jgi:HK97 family phage portal protein